MASFFFLSRCPTDLLGPNPSQAPLLGSQLQAAAHFPDHSYQATHHQQPSTPSPASNPVTFKPLCN